MIRTEYDPIDVVTEIINRAEHAVSQAMAQGPGKVVALGPAALAACRRVDIAQVLVNASLPTSVSFLHGNPEFPHFWSAVHLGSDAVNRRCGTIICCRTTICTGK